MNKKLQILGEEAVREILIKKVNLLANNLQNIGLDQLDFEVLFLFRTAFDKMYGDERMERIVRQAYGRTKTKEMDSALAEHMDAWAEERGTTIAEITNAS